MSKVQGMLSLEDLRELVSRGEIDTVMAGFSDLYGRFLGKRFDAEFFLESVAGDGTHGCDYLLTVDMEMEPVGGYRYANWEKGYGDFHLVPDFNTLRRADWLEKTAWLVCDVVDDATHARVPFAPRSLLRAQIDAAASAGFEASIRRHIQVAIEKH